MFTKLEKMFQSTGIFSSTLVYYRFLEEDCFVLFCFFRGGEGDAKMMGMGAQRTFQNNLGWRHVQVDSDSV